MLLSPAVEYVAGLVKVSAADFAKYDLTSRSAKNHRKQIREALKFRPATRADEEKLIAWLADEVCPVELVEDRLREALLVECRERSIEPPGRIDRIVTAAQTRAEKAFCARTIERLGGAGVARLLALVALRPSARLRAADGFASARARGRVGGRRPKLTLDQAALAQRLYDEREKTVQQIADMFSVPRSTVYGHLDKRTVPRQPKKAAVTKP